MNKLSTNLEYSVPCYKIHPSPYVLLVEGYLKCGTSVRRVLWCGVFYSFLEKGGLRKRRVG